MNNDEKLSEINTTKLHIGNGKWDGLKNCICEQRIHEITEKLLTTEYGSKEYRKLEMELLSIIL